MSLNKIIKPVSLWVKWMKFDGVATIRFEWITTGLEVVV